MPDYDQMYEFVEPHPSGGTCYIRLTARQAIDWTRRRLTELLGHDPGLPDPHLLDEFITVHWAEEYHGS